ncbi:17090_t:CDS:2, partial [Racocetra fulgida]
MEEVTMEEYYDYSAYEDPEEETWNTDPNDQKFVFTHDYLAATRAKDLLEDQSLVSLAQLVRTWEIELTSEESLDLIELG